MHARTGEVQVPADRIDDAAARLQEIPASFHGQQGYKGFVGLINRADGVALGISFWDSEADLQASDQLASQARQSVSGGDTDPGGRRTWEVVVDDEA